MRQPSAEEHFNLVLVEELRSKITHVGRWHLKGRRADSTRIWKMLFRYIEEILEDRYPFSRRTFIRLHVYPQNNQYSFMVQRHNRTCYRGYIAKREDDYNVIIKDLNSVLSHYNLCLLETAESQKRTAHHHMTPEKEYELKFIQK